VCTLSSKKTSDTKKSPVKITQKAARAERALIPVPHSGGTFSDKHHIFITRLKRGELWALNHLSVTAKSRVTPLFEIGPVEIPRIPKQIPGKPKVAAKSPKSLAKHTLDLLQPVKGDWGLLPFFLDTCYVPLGGIPSPASLKTIFEVARSLQLSVSSVVSDTRRTRMSFVLGWQASEDSINGMPTSSAVLLKGQRCLPYVR
jgi:Beta protein